MDKREQIKKAIENKDDGCFKMALCLAELADEETIDLIYNQFFVKGNLKEIEKARKEILSFLSGANYKNINDHKDNDDKNEEREILVGKLLNLRTFTGEYWDDDEYDYNDLDVYGLVDSLEKLVMPFRALIVNKFYEEAQDLLYKVLTSKIEYAFANENDDDDYEEYDWEDREIYDNDTIRYSDVAYQLLSYYFYLNKKLNKSSNDQRSKKLLKDYPGAKIKDLLSYPDLKYLD